MPDPPIPSIDTRDIETSNYELQISVRFILKLAFLDVLELQTSFILAFILLLIDRTPYL